TIYWGKWTSERFSDPENGWKMEMEAHFFMHGGCKVVESGVKWFHQNSIGQVPPDAENGQDPALGETL
ncbi:MAG: hypothetical protein Q4A48_06660, partial [Bacillota bacterium]|nr:hypothetical protein [Bacillota bacterium]